MTVAKKKAVRTKVKSERKQDDEPTFEESLASLEAIVAKLESGELGLGESLEAYEQGIGQRKACHRQLTAAERRVEILAGIDSDGNPILEAFDENGRGEASHDTDTSGRKASREELF